MKTTSTDGIDPFWRTDDGRTAAERAADYGIDLSLITENLRLTPEQRMDQNQTALDLVKALQGARGSADDLNNLVVHLGKNDCRFVVGEFGVALWGSSLLTRDVDVACDMSAENLCRAWQALEEFHPVHRMTPGRLPFTREQAESGALKNLYLSTGLGQLDLLGEIKGIGSFEECWKASEPIRIGGTEIRALTLDAIILSKRAMGRPKDLHAVLELEVIRERRGRG